MSDEENPPDLTDSSHSGEESVSGGSDSEAGPWREGAGKGGSHSDRDLQPPSPLDHPSGAKPKASNHSGVKPKVNNPSGATPKAKMSGKSSEQLRKEGNVLFLKTNFTEAIVKYEEAVNVNPGDKNNAAKCYSNIAHCYNKTNQFRKAIDSSSKAMAAQPDFERGYTRCATSYLNMDKPGMAAIVYFKGMAATYGSSQSTSELHKAFDDFQKTYKAEMESVEIYLASVSETLRSTGISWNMMPWNELDILALEKFILGRQAEALELPPKKEEKGVPELVSSSNSDDDASTDVSIENTHSDGRSFKTRNKKKKSEGREKDKGQKNFKSKILAEQEKLDKRREDEKKKEIKKGEKKKGDDRKEREKRELELIRKREDEKFKRNERKTDIRENVKVRFEKICKEASTCLFNMVPKSSMERYNEALEMIKTNYDNLWSASQYKDISHNEEVVVIKYLYARACGETNNYDLILDGLKKLDEIREQHKSVKFPTIFYCYCNLWKKLNRFEKAVEAAREGIEFLNQGFNVTPCNWPGMPSQLIQETKKDGLLERLKNLAVELKCPPKPDVVCKWKDCHQIQSLSHIVPSRNIYISDPDYKGHCKVYCRDNCRLDYHKSCWLAFKGEHMKLTKSPTEKDFFGQICFTPDCISMIVKIEIIEENGTKTTLKDNKLMDEETRKEKEQALKKEKEDELKRGQKFENIKKKNRDKLSTKNSKDNERNISHVNTVPSNFEPRTRTNAIITIQDDEFDETLTSGAMMSKSLRTKRSSVQSSLGSEHKPSLGDEVRNKTDIDWSRVGLGLASSITVSTGAQTDISSIDMDDLNLDPLAMKQENADLTLQMQELKDKFYKIQSERKLDLKEINDQYLITAEDNKNLMIENSFYKEQIGKMKKSVSEVTKITDELKKTNETLNIKIAENNRLKTELEDTNNQLREESSLSFQLNSQLNLISQDKMIESRTNDLLKAKLLQNDYVKYNEILGQKQANNCSIISHLRGFPELMHIPQVELALRTLDEFSTRLVLACEELNKQYETLVRQSQSNKGINELHLDLAYLEPPNLGLSFINLLQSFIMSQASSRSTFTNAPPPILSRPPPSFIRQSGSYTTNLQGAIYNEEAVTSSSLMPHSGLTPFPSQLSGMHLLGHSMTGPPLSMPVNQTHFSRSASAPHSFQAATLYTANSRTPESTGARPKVSDSGASSTSAVPTIRAKQYDKLITQLQKDYPSLSAVDAHSYIIQLRQSNNGKLSGMSVQDIVKKVGCFIERDRGMSGGGSAEDVSCSICFEDMCSTDSRYLNPCSHRFHNHCINLWLKSPGGAGSTCPMCRNYIVKEDEFPGLGSPRKF